MSKFICFVLYLLFLNGYVFIFLLGWLSGVHRENFRGNYENVSYLKLLEFWLFSLLYLDLVILLVRAWNHPILIPSSPQTEFYPKGCRKTYHASDTCLDTLLELLGASLWCTPCIAALLWISKYHIEKGSEFWSLAFHLRTLETYNRLWNSFFTHAHSVT